LEVEKVRISNGSMYGQDGYVRINMACPAALFEDGLTRLLTGLRRLSTSYKK